MSRLLCIIRVLFDKGLLSHQLSLLYGWAARKIPVSSFMSQHLESSGPLPVTPHCFLLLCSQHYLGEHLCINFPLDYRRHAKDNLAWCGFKAGTALWCHSPLPALICSMLYSPLPDGKLKSIILPTEMCFPEHYIKAQRSEQAIYADEKIHQLDGTVVPREWEPLCRWPQWNGEIIVGEY